MGQIADLLLSGPFPRHAPNALTQDSPVNRLGYVVDCSGGESRIHEDNVRGFLAEHLKRLGSIARLEATVTLGIQRSDQQTTSGMVFIDQFR